MGLDLRLLPVQCDKATWGYSHTILDCDRDYPLFERIRSLPTVARPSDFSTFSGRQRDGEIGYGKTTETPYGEPVECVLAEALAALPWGEQFNQMNRAIGAFLKELPPMMKVALYWH